MTFYKEKSTARTQPERLHLEVVSCSVTMSKPKTTLNNQKDQSSDITAKLTKGQLVNPAFVFACTRPRPDAWLPSCEASEMSDRSRLPLARSGPASETSRTDQHNLRPRGS